MRGSGRCSNSVLPGFFQPAVIAIVPSFPTAPQDTIAAGVRALATVTVGSVTASQPSVARASERLDGVGSKGIALSPASVRDFSILRASEFVSGSTTVPAVREAYRISIVAPLPARASEFVSGAGVAGVLREGARSAISPPIVAKPSEIVSGAPLLASVRYSTFVEPLRSETSRLVAGVASIAPRAIQASAFPVLPERSFVSILVAGATVSAGVVQTFGFSPGLDRYFPSVIIAPNTGETLRIEGVVIVVDALYRQTLRVRAIR